MICEEFKRKAHAGTHYCELEGQHMWSMMFTNGEGESCASFCLYTMLRGFERSLYLQHGHQRPDHSMNISQI